MNTSNTIALLPAFLPNYFEKNAAENPLFIREKDILDVANLLLRNSIQTISVLESRQYRKLDCLVGNFGCQVIAAVIATLTKTALLKECTQLKVMLTNQLEAVKLQATFNGNSRKTKYRPMPLLIHDLLSIQVSPEFEMVAKMHLLTCTKEVKVDKTTGYETHSTVSNRLSRMHKAPQDLIDTITNVSKASLSKSSYIYFRAEVSKVLLVRTEEESLLEALNDRYIKKEKRVTYSKDYYSVLHTMQGVFVLAERHQFLVAIKQIVKPNDLYILLLYRFNSTSESYCLVKDSTAVKDEPILVLEGLVQQGIQTEDLIETFQEVGFKAHLLGQLTDVKDDPYVKMEGESYCKPTLTTRDLSEEETKKLKYFTIDHVYCSSFKEICPSSCHNKVGKR